MGRFLRVKTDSFDFGNPHVPPSGNISPPGDRELQAVDKALTAHRDVAVAEEF
jgi:hypothetical protein